MSEARELSDKLKQVQEELRQTRDQLDKQRVLHAREQEALRKALEETRREAARLSDRVEQAKERRRRQAGALLLPPAAIREERPETAASVLVALVRPPRSLEEALPKLAGLLRMSPVDTRMRLALSQPSVLARLPAFEAEMLRDMLTAEGFPIVLAEMSQLAQRLVKVRRFSLEAEALSVESLRGGRQQVRYSELRLLVRGRRKSTTVETQEDLVYDPVYDTMERVETKTRNDQLDNFLWLYSSDVCVAITEETSFAKAGELRGVSRFATLQRLAEELRNRAPQVMVDERFLRGASLSLPMVAPEQGQEVVAGLTYEAIKEGMWP